MAQIEAGAHPEDVAETLGLHRSTVFGGVAKYREGGKGALKARPVPGRPPKLTGEQLRLLYMLIMGQDLRQVEFDFALWTREMIRQVIRREFGVALSVVKVGRLLARLGLSPQRPLHRAYKQNPEAVEKWKKDTYRAAPPLETLRNRPGILRRPPPPLHHHISHDQSPHLCTP